jgi:hypothetical protein
MGCTCKIYDWPCLISLWLGYPGYTFSTCPIASSLRPVILSGSLIRCQLKSAIFPFSLFSFCGAKLLRVASAPMSHTRCLQPLLSLWKGLTPPQCPVIFHSLVTNLTIGLLISGSFFHVCLNILPDVPYFLRCSCFLALRTLIPFFLCRWRFRLASFFVLSIQPFGAPLVALSLPGLLLICSLFSAGMAWCVICLQVRANYARTHRYHGAVSLAVIGTVQPNVYLQIGPTIVPMFLTSLQPSYHHFGHCCFWICLQIH